MFERSIVSQPATSKSEEFEVRNLKLPATWLNFLEQILIAICEPHQNNRRVFFSVESAQVWSWPRPSKVFCHFHLGVYKEFWLQAS